MKVIKGQKNLVVTDRLRNNAKMFQFNSDGVFITDDEYILGRCKGKFEIEEYVDGKRHRSSKQITNHGVNNIEKWTLEDVKKKGEAHKRLWLEEKGHEMCEFVVEVPQVINLKRVIKKKKMKKRPKEMNKMELDLFLNTLKEG